MRRLEKDESLCIGCHQCEEACSHCMQYQEES